MNPGYARRTELVVRYSDGVVIFSQTEPGTNKVNTQEVL